MEKLQAFYEDSGFIIAFLVLILIIQMTMSDKIAVMFLFLVLASMIMFNAGAFTSLLRRAFT
jgi:hypothetical protein